MFPGGNTSHMPNECTQKLPVKKNSKAVVKRPKLPQTAAEAARVGAINRAAYELKPKPKGIDPTQDLNELINRPM